MKQFKVSLSVLAIVFALASAFTVREFTPVQFKFIGTDVTSASQRVNPDNYQQEAVTCTFGSAVFCKIQAEPTGSPAKPQIVSDEDLYEALYNSNGSLPAPLTNKVYLKP